MCALNVTEEQKPPHLHENSTMQRESQSQPSSSLQDIHAKLQEMGERPLYNESEQNAWKKELFERLDRIRVGCGELCQINTLDAWEAHLSTDPVSQAPYLTVNNVDCPTILGMEELDASDLSCGKWNEIRGENYYPEELIPFYTLGGQWDIDAQEKPRCDIYLTTKAGDSRLWETGNVWKHDDIEQAKKEIEEGTHKGSYGAEGVNYVRDVLKTAEVKDKSILVIGSSAPWLEATLLLLGAKKVTTLEYGELVSEHEQIVTMTPDVFRSAFLKGDLEMFDAVVSHSSLEHSGLGRYGDALNPWGDILTIARAWCVTKPGGWMYLGLPVGQARDRVYANYHRIYGKLRWPLITTNWKPVTSNYTDVFDLFIRGSLWGSPYGGHGYIFKKIDPSTNN